MHRFARYARLGVELAIDEVWPEKSTGLEKRRRLKDSGRSPDTYIVSDRNPSQHVGVGLAQARPKHEERARAGSPICNTGRL